MKQKQLIKILYNHNNIYEQASKSNLLKTLLLGFLLILTAGTAFGKSGLGLNTNSELRQFPVINQMTSLRFLVCGTTGGDHGDLPDSYLTTRGAGGPCLNPGLLVLGTTEDEESAANPTPNADGDDNNPIGGDDEDGLVRLVLGGGGSCSNGSTSVTLTATQACAVVTITNTNPFSDTRGTPILRGYLDYANYDDIKRNFTTEEVNERVFFNSSNPSLIRAIIVWDNVINISGGQFLLTRNLGLRIILSNVCELEEKPPMFEDIMEDAPYTLPATSESVMASTPVTFNYSESDCGEIEDYSFAGTTAANNTISGIVKGFGHRGIPRAIVTLIDQEGQHRTARTNLRGQFTFTEVPTGTAIISVSAKGYTFTPSEIVQNIVEDVADIAFTGSVARPNR